jgi:release factor glutamine methyltransferase
MVQAVRRLSAAGCVAAQEEAEEILHAAGDQPDLLERMLERRCTGEPLAWVTGSTVFSGISLFVSPGVYVPRWQSEPLARHAASLLPPGGRAIDVGTGAGALARVLIRAQPQASVIGTEKDPLAADCARRNGVTVVGGDLFEGVPVAWDRSVDVIVGVLPYVPTGAIAYLPRDVQDFEPIVALDGGPDGLDLVRQVVRESPKWLQPRGSLLLEVGGDQPEILEPLLHAAGFKNVTVIADDDGDTRGIQASAS